jgi:hypothetical protein
MMPALTKGVIFSNTSEHPWIWPADSFASTGPLPATRLTPHLAPNHPSRQENISSSTGTAYALFHFFRNIVWYTLGQLLHIDLRHLYHNIT